MDRGVPHLHGADRGRVLLQRRSVRPEPLARLCTLADFLRKCSCRHWTRQEGDLRLGDAYCGNSVTTACGLVPEPTKGKGVYSLLYTASGTCSTKTCDHENVCRAYLVNEAEAEP